MRRVLLVIAVGIAALTGMGSCTVADKGDYTFADETGGTAGTSQGGSGGGPMCMTGERACDGDCIDEDACCTSDDCDAGESCVEHACQACQQSCPGPVTGTGTGECEDGECIIVCDGTLTACGDDCVDLDGNGQNCGACGNACSGMLVCQDGACTDDCGADLTECDASCVDVTGDVDHCGDCDTVCARPTSGGTALCQGGECSVDCEGNLDACNGECVDTGSDEANCGGCGNVCTGLCQSGVCCPAGQTNCGGTCFDLMTSPEHCGSCTTPCAGGQVCAGGSCSTGCGNLTQCGTECVDVSRNPNHCQRCGNQCLPPAMFGTAVCAGAAGCDIQCNGNSLRCGNTCCPPPPPNAFMTCDGIGNSCQSQCNPSFHACNAMPASCYSDMDVQHCGSGCLDCRQPNATVLCSGSRCGNICNGPTTFPCNDPSGKAGCGLWDFESLTPEGWQVDTAGQSSGWTGMLGANTGDAFSGSASLAIGFDGNGQTSGAGARYAVEILSQLCPQGTPVPWPPRRFVVNYRLQPMVATTVPPPAELYVSLRNGGMEVFAGCDTVLDSGGMGWGTAICDFSNDTSLVATRVGIVFRIWGPWQGTIRIDRVGLN